MSGPSLAGPALLVAVLLLGHAARARWRWPLAPALMLGWTAVWTEVLTRWLLPAPDPVELPASAHVTHTGEPALDQHAVPDAFRPPPGPLRAPPHPRVLFIGDSFTAGQGGTLGNTAPDVAGRALAAAGAPVEIVNHGIPGMSSDDEALLWARFSRWWAPDVLVWGFVLNDVGVQVDPTLLRALGTRGDDHIVDRSAEGMVSTGWRALDLAALTLRQRKLSAATRQAYLDAYDPAVNAEALAALERTLTEVTADVRARGGRVLVVIWPLLHQLDAYPFERPHAVVAALATRSGAEVLDLLPTFRGRDERALWANALDHHPNDAGYALAGQAIANALAAAPLPRAAPLPCPSPGPDEATVQAALADPAAAHALVDAALCADPDRAWPWRARAEALLRAPGRGDGAHKAAAAAALHHAWARVETEAEAKEVRRVAGGLVEGG